MEVKNLATTIFRIPDVEGRWMVVSGLAIVIVVLIMAIFAPMIAPYDPTKASGNALSPPSTKHLMGTDNLGRDIFSRIIYGSRIVLMVCIFSFSRFNVDWYSLRINFRILWR